MKRLAKASGYGGLFGTKAGVLAALGCNTTSVGSAGIAAGGKVLAIIGIASNPVTLGIAGGVAIGTIVFGATLLANR